MYSMGEHILGPDLFTSIEINKTSSYRLCMVKGTVQDYFI